MDSKGCGPERTRKNSGYPKRKSGRRPKAVPEKKRKKSLL
jgi:hypothetical protein